MPHQGIREENPTGRPREVRHWGLPPPFSEVSGVSVTPEGNPVVFLRGNRTWGIE